MNLRAAVIGLGVGERHAWGYASHDDVSLAFLCDRDPKRLQEVASRLPKGQQPILTTDPHEVLDAADVDMISIATFDDSHAYLTAEAMERGKHVMVEKPAVLHPEEWSRLRRICERGAVILTSNLILRTTPRFIRLKTMIESGELGGVFYMEGDYIHAISHKLTEGWRGRIPFYNIALGGGIHLVDLLLWLTKAKPVAVTAMAIQKSTKVSRFAFPDTLTLLVRTSDNTMIKSTTSLTSVHPHFHAVSVHGTKGTFVNGLDYGRFYRSGDGDVAPTVIDDPYPGYVKEGMIPDFVAAVAGKSPPPVSAEEVFASLAVGMAAWQSVVTGETVKLDNWP